MSAVRKVYGDSPLHLLAVLASFAVAGYAFFRIVESPSALGTIVWFVAAIVLHDLIAFPLYSALNLVAYRSLGGAHAERESIRPVPLINHVRIPIFLAGLALLMFFPEILGLDSTNYERDTGLGTGVFLDRWLGLCAALFLGSALIYAMRLRAAGREDRAFEGEKRARSESKRPGGERTASEDEGGGRSAGEADGGDEPTAAGTEESDDG